MAARRGTLAGRLTRSNLLSRFFRGERPERGAVRLHARRIYILPTREGFAAMFVCAALLIGAINYQASLGLMLAFLVAGVALVSMLHTQRLGVWQGLPFDQGVHNARLGELFQGILRVTGKI